MCIYICKNSKMKKLVFLTIMAVSLCFASQAQTDTKVKPTSSAKQTVHNAFSKHKEHNGYKVKKTVNGKTHKKKVKTEG